MLSSLNSIWASEIHGITLLRFSNKRLVAICGLVFGDRFYLDLRVAVSATAKLAGLMHGVSLEGAGAGCDENWQSFLSLLLSLPATLSDPASDHACRPGHHPAHVHPVHQPNFRRPGRTSDRGLNRDVAASNLSARKRTRTSLTFAIPTWSDEYICFCVSVLDIKPIVGCNLWCTIHLPLVGMREYPTDTVCNIFIFRNQYFTVFSCLFKPIKPKEN